MLVGKQPDSVPETQGWLRLLGPRGRPPLRRTQAASCLRSWSGLGAPSLWSSDF